MASDHADTLKALQIAVRMEIDGKDFYTIASQNSTNKMGKKLLQSLAKAEDLHRQRFIEIYDAIRDEKGWPKTALNPDAGKSLKTIFSTATKRMAASAKPLAGEIDAVQTAMKLENKTMDYYKSQAAKAAGSTEKDFYDTIAAEEREHHLVLLSYYDFLTDPAGWFVKTEHPSIDGG